MSGGLVLTRSCAGWKVIAPNGRTICRYSGPLARRRCIQHVRNLGRWS